MVCENQLYQAHKEMERVKRDMGGPGGQANMSEVVRVQSKWAGLGCEWCALCGCEWYVGMRNTCTYIQCRYFDQLQYTYCSRYSGATLIQVNLIQTS